MNAFLQVLVQLFHVIQWKNGNSIRIEKHVSSTYAKIKQQIHMFHSEYFVYAIRSFIASLRDYCSFVRILYNIQTNIHFKPYSQSVKLVLAVYGWLLVAWSPKLQMSDFHFLKLKCDLLGVSLCLSLGTWTAFRLAHYLSHFNVFIVFLFSLETSINKSISLMEIVENC